MKHGFRNPNIIPASVLMHMAWRNLVHKKLRAFLTVFGITIGIGAIFFLLSFGLGLQDLVTGQVLGNQSIKSIEISTPNSKLLQLDEKVAQKVRDLPHVVRVGTSYSFAGILQRSGAEIDAVTYGMDNDFVTLSNLNLASGRTFRDDDNRVALLNEAALQAVGLPTDGRAINQTLTLRIPLQDADANRDELVDEFTIIGVIGTGTGSEIFVPHHVFQTAGVKVYNNMKVEADNNNSVAELRRQIETLGLETSSPLDTIDQINDIFRFFNVMLAGFGSIGMIVAVLGMFNTLTISLLERTKEIGLMLAMGSRNRDIRRMFILEAVLLSLIGAIIGIVLAFIFGRIINLILNAFAAGRGVTQGFELFATPWWLVLGCIGFMVLVGLVVVYFPARRAAKTNPIDALRRE
jgi:ABC-type antimicrobial peptide transport system permease subunit